MKRCVSIHTFGCKLNQYESQAMAENLGKFEVSFSSESADLFIINSCTVTSEAERKLRQLLRRLKAKNPGSLFIVVGCYSELSPNDLKRLGVDVVLGVKEKRRIKSYVEHLLMEHSDDHEQEFLTVTSSHEGRTRAYLAIEDGCINQCSYCRIRLARGSNIVSKPPELVRKEFEGLVRKGFKEIVLTGVNIGYYGFGEGHNLVDLLKELLKLPGDWRIRLGSVDPDTVDRHFLDLMAREKRMTRHIHLSLQSGSDKILKSMKRNYTTRKYLAVVDEARSLDSRFSFTTDIIVGFPGEERRDFEETMSIIEEVGFLKSHVFRYSNRPGTEAAELKHQIRGEVKRERAKLVLEKAHNSRYLYLSRHIGKSNRVLIERVSSNWSSGYDEYYIPHRIAGTHEGFVYSPVSNLEGCEEVSDVEFHFGSMVH